MRDAFICDGVRTPVGRYGGGLAGVRADDLGAVPLRALLARYPQLDLERIDDVIFGCANQAGEDNRNVARMTRAWRKTSSSSRLTHRWHCPALRYAPG
jgi:Acetyl-CoA acetyltransferase